MDITTILVITIVFVGILLGFVVPLLRKRPVDSFVPGQYGMMGGTVCSRCELPYPRRVFTANLLVGKLDRCPHCGKVAIVARASRSALEVAEARFVGQVQKDTPQVEEGQTDRLRKQLEESRFED